ncbi:hypothetical protein JL100_034750 (plasmid) [Skermanella mucosa]|uniref:hypothetical protein n=1 Tax=Skermanella mucosa TaxID=1789672 RepID=UPI00192BEF77|nr:hypothetical protein [Skermanella mucosa]UEM24899.1 hypothetical protein JL100_034750 [Skermanella mucosa]
MPLLGPADTLELIGFGKGTGCRSGFREWIYVALHRTYGDWTHVYDVVLRPGCLDAEIRLIRVMPGDRRGEARSWAMAARGNDLRGRAAGPDDSLYGRGLAWCRPYPEGGRAFQDTARQDTANRATATKDLRCALPAVP